MAVASGQKYNIGMKPAVMLYTYINIMMAVALGQQYNIGEKPAIILYTYVIIIAGASWSTL